MLTFSEEGPYSDAAVLSRIQDRHRREMLAEAEASDADTDEDLPADLAFFEYESGLAVRHG